MSDVVDFMSDTFGFMFNKYYDICSGLLGFVGMRFSLFCITRLSIYY